MQADPVFRQDCWGERQRNAELLEFDRYPIIAIRYDDRKFTAREKSSRFAGNRRQIRFGQYRNQPVVVERVDQNIDVDTATALRSEQAVGPVVAGQQG